MKKYYKKNLNLISIFSVYHIIFLIFYGNINEIKSIIFYTLNELQLKEKHNFHHLRKLQIKVKKYIIN